MATPDAKITAPVIAVAPQEAAPEEDLQNTQTSRTIEALRREDCHQRLNTIEATMHALEKNAVEHRVRLENGTLVFSAVRADIAGLQTEVKEIGKQVVPKPIDWWKIVVSALGFLVTLLTAWWALSTQLNQRPTIDNVEKIMQGHASSPSGHPGINTEIRQLHDEQLRQSESLKGLTEKVEQIRQDVQDTKVDIRAMRGSRPSAARDTQP